jgi:hypothetical protein
MSHTILTIPINLKGENNGKKCFEIDKVLLEHFNTQAEGGYSPDFLKVIKFNKSYIKSLYWKIILKKMGCEPILLDINKANIPLLKEPTFTSTAKYLPVIKDYFVLCKPTSNSNSNSTTGSDIEKFINKIAPKDHLYQNYRGDDIEKISFEIEEVRLFVNRSKINYEIGYSFLSFTLKWLNMEENTITEFTKELSDNSDFFRWYNNDRDKKTTFCVKDLDTDSCQSKLDKLIEGNEISSEFKHFLERIKTENKTSELLNFIHLHEIGNELLSDFIHSNNRIFEDVFEIEQNTKPSILHLFPTKLFNEADHVVNSQEITQNIYKSIRVADRKNQELNDISEYEFKAIKPNPHDQFYILNEGAMVIKAHEKPAENPLINEYYPAFLFALNQRHLFHYLQKEINSLGAKKVNGNGEFRYDPTELRKLRGMLVKAESIQYFSMVSQYDEIDTFYSKLQDKFRIPILKDEYLNSVNGLHNMSKIAEEKDDRERKSNLEILIGVLAFLEVWGGIEYLLNFENNWQWWVSFGIFAIGFVFIIRIIVRINSKKKSGS